MLDAQAAANLRRLQALEEKAKRSRGHDLGDGEEADLDDEDMYQDFLKQMAPTGSPFNANVELLASTRNKALHRAGYTQGHTSCGYDFPAATRRDFDYFLTASGSCAASRSASHRASR